MKFIFPDSIQRGRIDPLITVLIAERIMHMSLVEYSEVEKNVKLRYQAGRNHDKELVNYYANIVETILNAYGIRPCQFIEFNKILYGRVIIDPRDSTDRIIFLSEEVFMYNWCNWIKKHKLGDYPGREFISTLLN